MAEFVRTFQLGAATITLINVGDLQLNLAEDYRLAEKDWPPGTSAIFSKPLHIPVTCTLIQTPTANVLVDASDHDVTTRTPYAIPGYQAPPSLVAQIAARGLTPDDITHVIITHTHFDHYSGVTQQRDGNFQPSYPKARYYVGQADWDNADMKKELENAEALPYYTFAVLHREGLLKPVSGTVNLSPEIQIIPAPGETPGHQIVRVASEGKIFYILGDLYHHPIEVEHSDYMSYWADANSIHNSRDMLVKAALAENALLSATHIPTIGRLKRTDSGVVWDAVEA